MYCCELVLRVKNWVSWPQPSHLPCGGEGEEKMPLFPYPCNLWWVREMTLPLTNYITQESGPCTLSGQHRRVELIERGVGEPREIVGM